MTERSIEELWYGVARLTVPVPDDVRSFQKRYEHHVPMLPLEAVQQLVSQRAPWSEMVSLIDATAPLGFLIYFRNDVHRVMELAGDPADCISYLMGNHVIAEQMFRYDPRVMMYAPLHVAIWQDKDGHVWFTADQPSTQFGSFDEPEIAAVGIDLDRKLAQLLAALELPIPDSLNA